MWHIEKIPKIAHFYWGNDTLSFLRYLTIFSFKKYNPDWKIRLYRPKIMYQGNKTWKTLERYEYYTGENYIKRLLRMDIDIIEVDFNNLGFNNNVPEIYKADFLRWKILSTSGGLWSDFDIIYIKPMDCLYFNTKKNKQIDTVVCYHNNHIIGFLLSHPQNNYYKYNLEQVAHRFNQADYQSIGSHILNAYFPSINKIKNAFPALNIHNLKMDVVYPLPDHSVPVIYNSGDFSHIKEITIGLHWYGGHPESGKWENTLTIKNYRKYNNIINLLIEQIIKE